MVEFSKARQIVIAAACALVTTAPLMPAWAQSNCPAPKGRDSEPPGLASSVELVRIAKAAKPEELSGMRASLVVANNACSASNIQNSNGKNLKLQACIADSAAMLARLDQSFAKFDQADCAFTNITRLSRDAATVADAWEGKALNYEAWGQPARALEAWREASAVPTQLRIRSYAKALGGAGTAQSAAEADLWYGKLNLLQAPVGYQYSPVEREALREWAVLRRDVLRNSAGAVEVWRRLGTAEAHFEVGKSYFNANNPAMAAPEFTRVIELKNEEGASPLVAEASYLLGLMTARNARTAAAWNEARRYSQDAGYSDPRYKRLTCLALIAAGDRPTLSSEGAESDACQVGMSSTAEDYLARGAYLLRRMQFLPMCDGRPAAERASCNDRRRNNFIRYANEARDAFSDGQRRLPMTAPGTPPPAFDWLGLGATTPLVELLRAGETLANSVTQANYGCTNLRKPAAGSPEYEFFDRLDLLGCAYKQYLP